MKARINLTKFPEGRPGYYAMMENEAEYERVKNSDLDYEKSKRVTHYLVPASVFERLLNLDRTSDKRCGHWELVRDEQGRCGEDIGVRNTFRCSCCENKDNDGLYITYTHLSNFCPECGADLRDVEEYAEDDPNKPEVT